MLAESRRKSEFQRRPGGPNRSVEFNFVDRRSHRSASLTAILAAKVGGGDSVPPATAAVLSWSRRA